MEVLPGIFCKTSYGCMCQSYCFFLAVFFFCLLLKKRYKNRVFLMILRCWFFSFFGQKSRVNNLAMVGSITWPSFWPKFCPERWPSYWPYFFFTLFLLKLVFLYLILPAERRIFLKNNKKTIKKRWPKLLTYDGQVIDPTAYICCEVIIWAKFGYFRCYYLGQVGVIIWAKLFLAYKNSGFKRFFAHTVII